MAWFDGSRHCAYQCLCRCDRTSDLPFGASSGRSTGLVWNNDDAFMFMALLPLRAHTFRIGAATEYLCRYSAGGAAAAAKVQLTAQLPPCSARRGDALHPQDDAAAR